jgi:hypothetical protein
MKTSTWLRAGLTTAIFAAGAAFAQTKATATDAAAAPAEDRSSAGAILFEDSMPRAYQQAFGVRDTRAEVAAIGQGVMEATVAEMQRDGQGPDTRALGGPPAPKTNAKPRKAPAAATPSR